MASRFLHPKTTRPMEAEFSRPKKFGFEVKFTFSPEDYNGHVQDSIASVSKDIKMEGFRKGKVPRQILQRRFGTRLVEESITQLSWENMVKVLRENDVILWAGEQLRIEDPGISDLKSHPGISVTVTGEIPIQFKSNPKRYPTLKFKRLRRDEKLHNQLLHQELRETGTDESKKILAEGQKWRVLVHKEWKTREQATDYRPDPTGVGAPESLLISSESLMQVSKDATPGCPSNSIVELDFEKLALLKKGEIQREGTGEELPTGKGFAYVDLWKFSDMFARRQYRNTHDIQDDGLVDSHVSSRWNGRILSMEWCNFFFEFLETLAYRLDFEWDQDTADRYISAHYRVGNSDLTPEALVAFRPDALKRMKQKIILGHLTRSLTSTDLDRRFREMEAEGSVDSLERQKASELKDSTLQGLFYRFDPLSIRQKFYHRHVILGTPSGNYHSVDTDGEILQSVVLVALAVEGIKAAVPLDEVTVPGEEMTMRVV